MDMMNNGKKCTALLAAAVMLASLSACQKKEVVAEEKGPAERAGEHIDQAAANAGHELNKVAEKAGQGLQQIGEKLQNAARDAQEKDKDKNKE
jgi:type IV secretory pathway VirB6-like protein